MSPNTFHLFSQLPCELRLQIWESAIKKRTTNIYDYSQWNWGSVGVESLMPQAQKKQSYGINYVRFVNTGDFIPLDCSWNKPRPTNRSAYLWHAGLWMACKESHEVMRKYWFNDSFYKENPEYVDADLNGGLRKWFYGNEEGVYPNRPERFSGHKSSCPTHSHAQTSPRGWGHYGLPPDGLSVRKLVRVMARRDKEVVPKITRGNAMQPKMKKAASSLLRPWKPIYLRTEDARGRRRLKKPLNIGVKFDPSWDEEMQKAVETTYLATVLRDLSPPMAFAIRLLFQVATDAHFSWGRSKVMLIDDVSEWQSFNTEGHGGCRIFNSGQEYVELGSLLSFSTHIPHPDSPMDGFAENVNYLFMGKLNAACQRRWGHLLDADFLIPVLRRDKQAPMIRQ
ncbi:uncharacterized protein FPRN_11717 [Fusarium proliferatum]|nr:uncharacterized protein FPRN_11717 [Fusarium proliferatum]